MAIITVTEQNYEELVLKAERPVLVDFWAEWCGPCRMVGPVIDELADFYDGDLKVCKLNVDENSDIAMRYQVMSIPTILLFKNGELVEKCIGARRRHEFEAIIEKYL